MIRITLAAFGVLGLAALVAVPTVASASPGEGRGGRAARADGAAPHGPLARRFARARHRAGHVLRVLDLTAEQKASLKASREAAAPVREDLKAKVQAILAEARKGERTPETRKAARAQIQAAMASARASVEPSASRFVGSLTADQKATLVEKAKAHGKTFDEAKLVKRVEGVLVAPEGRGAKRHRHPGRR